MKKNIIITLLSVVLTLALSTSVCAIYAGSLYFDHDPMDNDWYDIDEAYEDGYMFGVGGTDFAADRNVTYAELVTVMYRLAGTPKVDYTHSYSDKWYQNEMTWGASIGLVDEKTNPENFVTRDATVQMLYNLAVYLETDVSAAEDISVLEWFHDSGTISPEATKAWCYVIKNKIILGDGWAKLMVNGPLTRRQLAKILSRSGSKIALNIIDSVNWNIPEGKTQFSKQGDDTVITGFSVGRICNRYIIENSDGEYICTTYDTHETEKTDINLFGECPYIYGTLPCYEAVYYLDFPYPYYFFTIPDSDNFTVTPMSQGLVHFEFKGLSLNGYGIEKITYEGNTVTVYGRRATICKTNVEETDYTIVFADK